MNNSRPFFTLISGLCVILILALVLNLGAIGTVTAFGNAAHLAQEDDKPATSDEQDDDQEDDAFDQEEIEEDDDFDDEDFDQDEEDDFEDEDEDIDEEGEWDEEDEDDRWQDEEEEEEGEWDEEEEDEWEEAMVEVEFERTSIESNIGRLELITRLSEIADNDTAMAGYAIMHIGEYLDTEEAIDLLETVRDSGKVQKSIVNLTKMKLAEIYAEEGNDEEVKKILASMLMPE